MKIKIQAKPGELHKRREDLIAVVDRLVKAEAPMPKGQRDLQIRFPVVEESIKQARKKRVDRLRKLMIEKFDEVIG